MSSKRQRFLKSLRSSSSKPSRPQSNNESTVGSDSNSAVINPQGPVDEAPDAKEEVKVNNVGLTVLHDTDDAVVDVVFVHGMLLLYLG